MKQFQSLLAAFLLPVFAFSQQVSESGLKNGVNFEANKNQWPSQVSFMSDIAGGRVFFESTRFTFFLHSTDDLEKAHEDSHHNGTDMRNSVIRSHAYYLDFTGAKPSPLISGNQALPFYRNYFLGNDPSRWAAAVPVYNSITYHELYNGIDLNVYGSGNNLEYDYLVYPGSDPDQITQHYEGLNAVSLDPSTGNLLLQTSFSEVVEQHPVAWQIIDGKKVAVKCSFMQLFLNGKKQPSVKFVFPAGYDKNEILVIDPVLVAATYSGATMTNYGHCATYDNQGNIYTGAISFGQGYPVTAGAVQTIFSGATDWAISKLSPNGSALLFATYLGGSDSDYPHSMVVDASGNLYAYGSTYSTNFPTTAGAFDQTYNNAANSFMTDIAVAKFNSTGTVLIGSTYVGGNGNDGNNSIYVNYGDTYRGEIILDANDNPIIGSFSQSNNFPVTAGCFDNSLGGTQDAVVFELNSNLTVMNWATYLGGNADDAAFGLTLSPSNEVYVAGATSSNNFPTLPGTLHPSYQGGTYDGFITLLNSNGTAMVTSTYFGSAGQDEVFFIDLDVAGNVFVFGQSTSSIPTTAGVYSNPNSPQFITKLDPGLFSVLVSTVFGGGNMNDLITPTAFMIDVCDHIYAAGWGSVTSYPVSAGCIQPTTDGNDFYLLVLDQNATAMMYATYFGANGGWEHVDGGTSRFDPNGIVYEAICQGATNMTTTPGAYSPTNQVGSYDVAVFKIDFQAVGVIAQAVAVPSDTLCINQVANFSNGSMNASDYSWDFGDGSPVDTNAAPSHVYTSAGTYVVTLVAIDSASCNFADTVNLVMTILPLPQVNLGNDTTICGAVNQLLNASSPGCTYLWNTGATSPTLTATAAGIYWVQIDNGFCQASDTIEILSFQPPNLGHDTSLCEGQTILLDAGNPGSVYSWSTGATTQTIVVATSGMYWVDVSSGSCAFRDSIGVTVNPVPAPDLGNDTAICPGATLTLSMTDPLASYFWSNNSTDMSIDVDTAGTFWVVATIGNCVASDTIHVSFLSFVDLGSAVSLCDKQEGLVLDAGNPGAQYSWSTGATTQTITVEEPGMYWVDVLNSSNCPLHDTIEVTGNIGADILYVPNCFTPNNDGRNETFCVVGPGISEMHMQIFDRWGELIFESDAVNNCWDGTYKGQIVQEGVYVVRLRYMSTCTAGMEYEAIRHVTVLPRKR
jgi:gliding motility-associated-like protein